MENTLPEGILPRAGRPAGGVSQIAGGCVFSDFWGRLFPHSLLNSSYFEYIH